MQYSELASTRPTEHFRVQVMLDSETVRITPHPHGWTPNEVHVHYWMGFGAYM